MAHPASRCAEREGGRERGPKWTLPGRLPRLTGQFLNGRIFQGEGSLWGWVAVGETAAPRPKSPCPAVPLPKVGQWWRGFPGLWSI